MKSVNQKFGKNPKIDQRNISEEFRWIGLEREDNGNLLCVTLGFFNIRKVLYFTIYIK